MPYVVDFEAVSAIGLDSFPVAEALAGLRANEAVFGWLTYEPESAGR
jgi:hypothetical protein